MGFAFICAGAWLLYEKDNASTGGTNPSEIMNTIRDLGVAVIILGIILIFLTIFALAASIRENVKLLKIVSRFATVIFA